MAAAADNNLNNINIIKNRLARTYRGTIDVPTLYSSIDILSTDRIIVVKSLNNWAEGVGLLYSHATQFPNKTKHLHIHNTHVNNDRLNKIMALVNQLNISLTVEQ